MAKVKNVRVDSILLLVFSLVDLTFGFISMFIPMAELQICSLVASCITFTMIVRVVALKEMSVKSEIISLIIGLLDIITGILSVVLAYYMITGAISVAISCTKVTKFAKTAVQTGKVADFVKTCKPLATKAFPRLATLLITFIISQIKKRGTPMENEEKKQTKGSNKFVELLKSNKMTVGFSSVAVAFSAILGYCVDYVLPAIAPNLTGPAYYATLVAISVIAFIVLEVVIVLLGKDSRMSYAVSKLAEKIGVSNAYNALVEFNDNIEKVKAEEEAKAAAKEEELKLRYRDSYKTAVVNGEFDGSLAEYIEVKKQEEEALAKQQAELEKEQAEANLKAQWLNEIANGQTELAFADWKVTK